MNIISELADTLDECQKLRTQIDELTSKLDSLPEDFKQELSHNLERLKRNLGGKLVQTSQYDSKSKTKSKSGTVRAPRGMRQWMLYATIQQCVKPGDSPDTQDDYYFLLSQIWDTALSEFYRVDPSRLNQASKTLRQDFETFQSSSRTRISSDELFVSEAERGKYKIADYQQFIEIFESMAFNKEALYNYLESL